MRILRHAAVAMELALTHETSQSSGIRSLRSMMLEIPAFISYPSSY